MQLNKDAEYCFILKTVETKEVILISFLSYSNDLPK